MKCQKCGSKKTKKELDNQGLCIDCSNDLRFKARMSIVSREDLRKREDNEEWEFDEDFKNGQNKEYDFYFIAVGIMIAVSVYLFYSKDINSVYSQLSFLGAFFRPLILINIIGFISVAVIGLSTEVIKRIWIFIAELFNKFKYVKFFSIVAYISIVVIASLLIAIKSRF